MKKAGWLKNGVATPHGVVTASGKMLKRRKMTERDMKRFEAGMDVGYAPSIDYKDEPLSIAPGTAVDTAIMEDDAEAVVVEMTAVEDMSKEELEEVGRDHGVELDRRKSKKSLVKTIKGLIDK